MAELETCENCKRSIGELEQVFIHENHIVCINCNYILENEGQSSLAIDNNSTEVIDTSHVGQPCCNLCGGIMTKKTVSSGNVIGIVLALLVLAVGIFISVSALFCGGPLLGIPLCILALFMGGKRKKVLNCMDCGNTVDWT